MNFDRLSAKLELHGQSHLLAFWDQLDTSQRQQLSQQINEVDFELLDMLIEEKDAKPDFAAMAASASPPPAVSADGSGMPWTLEDARIKGEAALRGGKLGALLVAGGQGTRLGFDQPKGMFPIGPVSGRTLFQIFADRILATSKRFGVSIPWYIMTSEATDTATREYFESNKFLGLAPEDVRIFKQGTMPAVSKETGRVLLADPCTLAVSPDGHGGTVSALAKSGNLADAQSRGIEQLFYFQVDNPLVDLLDPVFIGHHLMAGSELTSQVIRKRYPTERVGNVVDVDGNLHVIEYSDLPDAAAQATNTDGSLKFWAGSIAVHVFDVGFVDRAATSITTMPFHRAIKKVTTIDDAGQPIEPTEPNAVKFEKFIFDLLPAAKNGIVVEVDARTSFAPVKNADGADNDTPSLAKDAIANLHRGWLRKAGAVVDDDTVVEIASSFALDQDELSARIDAGTHVDTDCYFDRSV